MLQLATQDWSREERSGVGQEKARVREILKPVDCSVFLSTWTRELNTALARFGNKDGYLVGPSAVRAISQIV